LTLAFPLAFTRKCRFAREWKDATSNDAASLGEAFMFLEKLRLDGRVAVVTGAAQGIGLAICEALGEAGARVVATDINQATLDAAVASLTAKGAMAEGRILDVTQSADVDAVAAAIGKAHGRVDILVANAGIAISNIKAEEMTDEIWRKHMAINLDGVFWCDRAFGRIMLEKGKGSIINIGSMSGLISNKPQEQAAYNATKAGVHHLTKSLAGEWATRGVRVNAVAPTYIETPLVKGVVESNPAMVKMWMEMTPMHRFGQPHEIASVVHFLASDASSLMTGSVVVADGGFTVW
jgi:NAD(P)-dependent dehydrogenase (short-subunit alcohol dehydrogenase family)